MNFKQSISALTLMGLIATSASAISVNEVKSKIKAKAQAAKEYAQEHPFITATAVVGTIVVIGGIVYGIRRLVARHAEKVAHELATRAADIEVANELAENGRLLRERKARLAAAFSETKEAIARTQLFAGNLAAEGNFMPAGHAGRVLPEVAAELSLDKVMDVSSLPVVSPVVASMGSQDVFEFTLPFVNEAIAAN